MAWSKNPFRKILRESALNREIAFHIEELIRMNLSKGMSPEEARQSGNPGIWWPGASKAGDARGQHFEVP